MNVKTFIVVGLAVFVAIFSFGQSAFAMNCDEDSLSDVSSSGSILEMLSGKIYRVDDADQVDTSIWLSTEDVLVCTKQVVYKGKPVTITTMINKDESGEEVGVERLK